MEFGIFDHLDRSHLPLDEYYESRLRLIEAYDRLGYYSYHLAEHHFTPLGMAPSPSVFLSAIAQRTKRIRFGPLVLPLSVHHPLRVVEEICMLDHLSRGRLDLGFGRGSVPVEVAYYGVDAERREQMYRERLDVILKAFATDNLTFEGEFGSFYNVPMELKPYQKPHPPIYYGAHSHESAERAARRGLNIICNDPPDVTNLSIARYKDVMRELHGAAPPERKIGISRMIVVADSDEHALRVARRAYLMWRRSFTYLHELHGITPALGARPPQFDGLIDSGKAIAGSAETVARFLCGQIEGSGANYIVGQFAFGDMSLDELVRSAELFAEKVMPACRAAARAPEKMPA